MVAVVYSRLQQVTEWLHWVTTWYRLFTVGYSSLQQVTEWLPSGLQQVTTGYRLVTVGTSGYSRLPSGYSVLQ